MSAALFYGPLLSQQRIQQLTQMTGGQRDI
jgi:hypothetical protein